MTTERAKLGIWAGFALGLIISSVVAKYGQIVQVVFGGIGCVIYLVVLYKLQKLNEKKG